MMQNDWRCQVEFSPDTRTRDVKVEQNEVIKDTRGSVSLSEVGTFAIENSFCLNYLPFA